MDRIEYSMNYSDITACDIVNGTGIGVVLWIQGCELNCKGCQNPESHDFKCGTPFTEATFDKLATELKKPYYDRLTLSGGHPLAEQNYVGCLSLCKRIKADFPKIKIWIYSGLTYEVIKTQRAAILKYCDVLVDGPFIEEQRDITLPFRGSANQRVIDIQKSLKKGKVVLFEDFN